MFRTDPAELSESHELLAIRTTRPDPV